METRGIIFTAKPGAFREAVKAYRQYKKEKEERMEKKLQQLEETIQQAKSDPFYKVEMI